MVSTKDSKFQPEAPNAKPTRTWGETYLTNYNAISAFFWFNIPLRLIQLYTRFGSSQLYDGTADYVTYVQTMAILELIHSATGLVRAPMMTTTIQVFSRIFLTWGVVQLFPNSVRDCPAYPVMIAAWSITEVIRYSFYAWNLLDDVPYFLLWLRYSTFWVLYPIGVGAELWTTTAALKEAYAWNPIYAGFMAAVMVGYIPGFSSLYTHMIRQRRKVLGAAGGKKNINKKKI